MVKVLEIGVYFVAVLFLSTLLLRILMKAKGAVKTTFILGLSLLLGSYTIRILFELLYYYKVITNAVFLYWLYSLVFLFACFASLCWYFYIQGIIDPINTKERRKIVLAFIPLVIMVICLIISRFTGFLFNVDDNGVVVIGRYYRLLDLFSSAYLLVTLIQNIVKAMDKKEFLNKPMYIKYSLNIMIPLVGAVLQIFLPTFDFFLLFLVFAIVLIYMDIRDSYISRDPQTGFYNKNSLLKFLDYQVKHCDAKHPFYLMMFDIDHFKRINDQYGHLEGDNALVRLSSVLDELRTEYGIHISRFGGDEFTIILNGDSEEKIKEIYTKINILLNNINSEEKVPYKINVSTGYVRCDQTYTDAKELIKLADEKMYEEKKRKDITRL